MAKKALVVIDPGHGGGDPGAVATSGVREADINLALALLFKRVVEAMDFPFLVALTRDSDVFISLADRAARTNALKPDCFISFHANAAGAPQASGFEVWTTPGETPADSLATNIYEALSVALPYDGRPDFDDGDPDREARFYVLRYTEAPAVLVEFGFLTNAGDLLVLTDPHYQNKMAVAVADSVSVWLDERGDL